MNNTKESILRIATFNIRFDTHGCPPASQNKVSSIVIPNEAPWNVRRIKVADTINFHRIELVGIQEALYNQVTDLENLLGPDWNWIGVGREDGKNAGEFVPIFYKKNRLKLLDSKYFWLSEEPNVPGSIGWDAALTRVVTQATFQDLLTNSTFVWINTHFDHAGVKARLESSKLLLNHVQKLKSSSSSNVKVFLSGDFNCEENDEPYELLTGKKYQNISSKDQKSIPNPEDLSKIPFSDTRYEINGLKGGSFGFSKTFTGFSRDTPEEGIDFVLVDNESISSQSVKVINHGVVSNLYDDGMYISDHRPVISDLLIQ